MKLFKQIFIVGVCVITSMVSCVYAAKISILAPKTVSSNGEPLSLSIMVDDGYDTISGVSGTFSFNSTLFDVKSISTNGSIISLWAESPRIVRESNFNGRTSIHFEGIIPGGYSGVRSAYAVNGVPGVLFTMTLIPKVSGRDVLLVSDVEMYAYDENATKLSSTGDSVPIFVPQLTRIQKESTLEWEKVGADSVTTTFNQSDLIGNGATYLYISDTDSSRAIDHIQIAESRKDDSRNVAMYEWRDVANPYILQNQARQKFIHVKILYTNNTYGIVTIPPVENSQKLVQISRILIGILVVMLLLFFYGKNSQHLISKNISK